MFNRYDKYDNDHAVYPPAGFFHRVAAMFYDSIIMLAILLFGTLMILPLNHGYAIPAGNSDYRIYLIVLIALFYLGFWLQGGQTLGMLAWRIKLLSDNNQTMTFKQALIRFAIALPSILFFGLGFFWMLYDKNKKTLYDRLSKTKIVTQNRSVKGG